MHRQQSTRVSMGSPRQLGKGGDSFRPLLVAEEVCDFVDCGLSNLGQSVDFTFQGGLYRSARSGVEGSGEEDPAIQLVSDLTCKECIARMEW